MTDAGNLTLDRVRAPAPAPAALIGPPWRSPGTGSRWVLAAAALIVMAGAAIRFTALSTSLWFDESVTVQDVSGSFGQMLHRVANHEASPPFYFVCLWIWRHLVGDTGADLRALSALAGTITIALAFYVARRFIGTRAGLVLAACVAVSPALVYYSTEMRMYGVLVLITGVSFAAFLFASESPNRTNLSLWAVASVLALWTQYYAALAVVPQGAWLLRLAYQHRSRAHASLIAVGGAAVAALPLTYLIVYQGHRAWPYGAHLLSSVWQRVPLSIHDTGTTFGSLAQGATVGPAGPARDLLTVLIVLIGAIVAFLALRHPEGVRGQLPRALFLMAGPLLIVLALVQSRLLVEARYLLTLWLPIGLAASYALTSSGWLGAVLTSLLLCIWVGIGVVSLVVPKLRAHDDTLGAARSLKVAHTDRLIAISDPWDVLPFREYRPRTSAETRAVVPVRELDIVAMPAGTEPSPAIRARPSSTGAGVLPSGLRLVQVIKGATFLVERFVASSPVPIRVDGMRPPFTSGNWRFLAEPTGGRMGGL